MKEQSSIKLVAGALALLLLVPALAGTNMQSADAATATGIMVPLYTYPGGTWDKVVKTKNDHPNVPVVAIVNPASGPGGSQDSNYVSGIGKLKDAGVIVLGYVSTAYTNRAMSAVKGDIDKWDRWYDIDGIFFDEQTNWSGKEWYYNEAGNYAESKGLDFTVGNPGANSIPSYLDTVDVVLIYESPGLPNLNNYQSWSSYDNSKLGMIPFGVGSLPTNWINNAAKLVGWIYVTNDVLPNPWDSLPPYYGDMTALLDNGSTGPAPEPTPTPTIPKHTLTIKSVDQNGKAIDGMWMEIKKGGSTVKTGFTPLSLTLEEATYAVSAANYQQIIFDHWQDGSTSSTKTTSLTANTELTAHYNNGAVATTPLSVSLKADKTTAPVGASVSFSTTIQGGTSPYTWSVNFGDGTSSSFTSATSVSKTYSAAGTYSAVATAKDAAGKTATSTAVAITITQGTSTLTVNTVNAAGSTINGYWTVLSQNGATIKTAFSPASFTLNNGQTYQVSVSDYGQFFFDHWSDGSTNREKTVVGGQTTALTAFYRTTASSPPAPEPEPEEATLTVKSVDLDGKTINGLWMVIEKDGKTVKTGYTPMTFAAETGSTYEVSVANYKNYVFDHWETGSTSASRMVTLSADMTITAHYSTGPKEATLTIKSVGLDGKEFSGMWTVVESGGSTVKTGYTSLSYSATAGTQYTVSVADYKNFIFDHWEDGSKNRFKTITPSDNTVLTAYYKQ